MGTRSRAKSAGANVLRLDVPSHAAPCVGTIVAWDSRRGARVDFPGNASGPVHAESILAIDADIARHAIESRQGVLLLFAQDRIDKPIIVGLLQEPVVQASRPDTARVDGKRVEITGAEEVVLKCGRAEIVLRKNGRIAIRGVRVETRAKGVNRIKGGSVQIN